MSSLIGGRSGNRGRCAQPCRLPYTLVDKNGKDLLAGKDAGQYLLSPKDLNTLRILPQMIEAGVISYKIEGRMKRPEYVAVVVDAYRRAMDSYKRGAYEVPAKDLANIEQIFNRDFTTAYLEKHQGRLMMSDRRPNNRGVLIGRVQKLNNDRTKALVKLDKAIRTGDGLEFWVKVGGRVGTTVNTLRVNGKIVEEAAAGSLAEIDVPKGVRLNDRVFRTLDSGLMAYAGQFYGEKNKKRIPVTAKVTARMGNPLEVILTDADGNTGAARTDFIAEPARKHALDEAAVRKQTDRLGTTEYKLDKLETESKLYQFTAIFQRTLQDIIFSCAKAEDRIFILNWANSLLDIQIDDILTLIVDNDMQKISDTVLTEFSQLKQKNYEIYLADAKSYGKEQERRDKQFNSLLFKMRKGLR